MAATNEPCQPESEFDEVGFIRFFSRHLVSMGCIYERRDDHGEWQEKKFFITAFAFQLKGSGT